MKPCVAAGTILCAVAYAGYARAEQKFQKLTGAQIEASLISEMRDSPDTRAVPVRRAVLQD